MKKGVIFDMDGVLFDTERIYQECWWATALRFDDDPDPSFPMAMCGTGKGTGEKMIATYFPEVDIKEFETYCYSLYGDTIAEKLPEKPGVREILTFFREEGIPIAVASSSPSDLVGSNLTRAGIKEYFDAIIGGDQVEQGKPAPDIFLKAAEEIGCKPEDCYVFEDGKNGLSGARAAGCSPVMIIDTMRPDRELASICVGVFESLTEALEAIRQGRLTT